MQLLLKDKQLKVIECNVRASRSFPFISKVSGCNLIELITQVFLNQQPLQPIESPQLRHLGVKTPVFSYNRFKGCDPVAQVEMSSTGEVACIGKDLLTTFYRSWQAAGQTINGKRLLIGAPQSALQKLAPSLTELHKQGWLISADDLTCTELNAKAKNFTHLVADIPSAIKQQQFDLVINIPENVYDSHQNQEQFTIRRQAIDYHIPLITNLQLANLILQCLILEQ
jgi:hypothetical protein